MSASEKQAVTIWDLPVRLFHWILAILVALNLILGGEDAGWEFTLHVVAGYLIGFLVLYRIVWGLIGTRHARFGDFVVRWPAVRDHIRGLLRLQPPRTVGHNPIGGWMIVALLVMLVLIVATGLFGHGRHTAGPLSAWLPVGLSGLFGDVHGVLTNVLIALIAVHIAGVLADWVLLRENLVRAMITGRKWLGRSEAAREAGGQRSWSAIVLAVVMLVLFGAALGGTNFQALSQGGQTQSNHADD